MRSIKLVLLVSMIFLGMPSLTHAQRVAVLGEDWGGQNEDVRSKLEALGFFEQVDSVNLLNTTPTLDELNAYCAVLAFSSEGGIDDNVALGNNLADYVDAGGGVVAAVFATASLPFEGRFNDENYWAIVPSHQQQGIQAMLGQIFIPDHPILEGVNSFDGGIGSFRPSVDSLHPEAVRVANWTGDDNIPLVATRVVNGVARADLGFFPISSDVSDGFWVASTDGARLMANALLYVCDSLDLAVTKTAAPDPVNVGEELLYTLEVANNGPGDATGVVLTDSLPSGVDFVSATPAGICSESAGVVSCAIGDLAAGATATVILAVNPQIEGSLLNQASVVSDQTDTNPVNNSASATTTVLAPSLPVVSGGGCSVGSGAQPNALGWIGMGASLLGICRPLRKRFARGRSVPK